MCLFLKKENQEIIFPDNEISNTNFLWKINFSFLFDFNNSLGN